MQALLLPLLTIQRASTSTLPYRGAICSKTCSPSGVTFRYPLRLSLLRPSLVTACKQASSNTLRSGRSSLDRCGNPNKGHRVKDNQWTLIDLRNAVKDGQ